MTLRRILVWVTISLSISTQASSQSFPSFHVLSIVPQKPLSVKTSKDLELSLTLRIRQGYHINSSRPADDYLIPTKLTWDTTVFPLKSIDYPDGEDVIYSFSKKPLSVYSGEIKIVSTFRTSATLRNRSKAITGSLRYQACNERACFPPRTISVKIPLLY